MTPLDHSSVDQTTTRMFLPGSSVTFLVSQPVCSHVILTKFAIIGDKVMHENSTKVGFEIRQFSCVIEVYIRPTPVAVVVKIWELLQKISYDSDNSLIMRDRAKNVSSSRVFSRSRNLMIDVTEIYSRPTYLVSTATTI